MKSVLEELQTYGELMQDTNFKIVILHPLADESDLDEEIKSDPNAYHSCDLYWAWDEKLIFISIMYDCERKPFVSYYKRHDIQFGDTFAVFTNQYPLKSTHVKRALEFLASWLSKNSNIIKKEKKIADEPLIISTEDICNSSS